MSAPIGGQRYTVLCDDGVVFSGYEVHKDFSSTNGDSVYEGRPVVTKWEQVPVEGGDTGETRYVLVIADLPNYRSK